MKMKKLISYTTYFFILALCFFFAENISAQPPTNARWEYIQRYKKIAVDERNRAGIPASIKLAQGLLESGAGTSALAREAKNHFGVKCGSDWRGDTYYLKDDDYDENGVLKESCFRVYNSPEESYIAHSEFLRDPNKAYRYGFLFRLEPTDYKKWAKGLTTAGYATSPTYGDALIGIIDQYKLYDFDTGVANPGISDVIFINDVKMITAKLGQTPAELAQTYRVKLKCLLAYNEELKGANQPLDASQHIFLQRKRRFFRGGQKEHTVRPGETMFSISQAYGVRLKSLRKKNKLDVGQEPAFGERLHLRGWRWFHTAPKLRNTDVKQEEKSNPFDEGTGKIPHIDETNSVDPSDLKPSGNTTNSGNSNNTTPSSNNNGSGNTTNNGNNGNNNSNNGTTNPPVNTNGNNSGQPNNNNSTVPTTRPTTPTTPKPTTTPTTNSGDTTTPKPTTKPTVPTTKPEVIVKPDTPKPTTPTTVPTTKPTTPTTPKPTTPAATTQFHTVEKGETLYSISKRYGLTVDALKKLNNMMDNNLGLGQKLKLN